ncbi:hypothetical protein C8Q72DRAFT_214921 [Fomitopsis betulina]|nr:hypothetical protein C8Q72DRAFT_214921 [Fomitopsis betulina]
MKLAVAQQRMLPLLVLAREIAEGLASRCVWWMWINDRTRYYWSGKAGISIRAPPTIVCVAPEWSALSNNCA